jgi:hypothetical protein
LALYIVRLTMPPYTEQFPVGTPVRIADHNTLEAFRANSQRHNPLAHEQLRFAGRDATICDVDFYHGGDVIYGLVGIPGVWHESCLASSGEHDA